MRLDSVDMLGFKSFCDRQQVSFGGGVTGIVGPNGCGKSNISDAINWVLGEQSAKSLRGQQMADVIFDGTASRKPLGLAEVSHCCAPKLLNQAALAGLAPLSLAEFYFGRENRSQTRQHGRFYAPCTDKCSALLGFMLCGAGEQRDLYGG